MQTRAVDGDTSLQDLELDERQWALLLSTYESREALLMESEVLGERRLQVLLTVVGAAGVAIGLSPTKSRTKPFLPSPPRSADC